MPRVAILDDYAGMALDLADWSPVQTRCEVTVFDRHLSEPEAAEALRPFDVICTLRERIALPRTLIERLPNLKLLVTTGMRNAAFDMTALAERGVVVCGTEGGGLDTAELTWGLILGAARRIAEDHREMREGLWQTRIGHRIAGKTLGLLGLGRLGTAVARVGLAFDMKVIAWSQNLTAERAAAIGVEYVAKEVLLRRSDILSVHLVLSQRSRGLIGRDDIALMKSGAILVNTSRGPIVDTEAVIKALEAGRLGYAAFDVYDREPLAANHPLRRAPNLLLTPHVGYVTEENYRSAYPQIVENIAAYLDGRPMRVI